MEHITINKTAIDIIEKQEKKRWNITGEMWLRGVDEGESTHFEMFDTVSTEELVALINKEEVDDITSHYISVLSGSNTVIYIWADTPLPHWTEYNDKRLCIRYYERLDTDSLKFTLL
jgi:hypothetical protein